MNCPRCNFRFGVLAVVGADEPPDLAPMICEGCAGLLLLEHGVPRIPAADELIEIQKSPAFRDIIRPVRAVLLDTAPPPVDRSKTMLTTGEPVPTDGSHTANRGDGQQRGYVVLTDEERLRGFVRPYREAYRHVGTRPRWPLRDLTTEEQVRYARFEYVKYERYPETESPLTGRYWTAKDLASGCGTVTRMGRRIAETYARDPEFYGATFCAHCGRHFPLAEFVWEGTSEQVGS